ncbi:MAG TPA: phosphoribosylformylglycinamidine synthase subunit PurQ [Bacteroidota bacterium]
MSKVKFGIVVFPGSNCDHDAHYAASEIMRQDARFIWHKDSSLGDSDVVILPGGFSYGDYLRCGAIARFSPIMKEVVRFARQGGLVVGICNGFQILTEAGLLPGTLLRNESLRFVCKDVYLRIENPATRFTGSCSEGDVLRIPIAHGDGNYFADPDVLKRLEEERRIVFRYCTPAGEITADANPNGSSLNIAGIMNETGNVLGLMPHPERACDPVLGNTDGQMFFRSVIESFAVHEVVHNLS